MIVSRSMHPDYLSNAYLVADGPGSEAVIIDAGAPIEPLMAQIDELQLTLTHVLLTHDHHDHTTHVLPLEERYGVDAVYADAAASGMSVACGALTFRAVSTPGHCDPHVAWLVERDGEPLAMFTGDALFRETVGGTLNGGEFGLQQLRSSILESILALPETTILYPGHTDQTTVAHELAHNPFVRAWQGTGELGSEQVSVAGNDARLLVEGPDYDGGTKAWVRFSDGNEAIVGGSMVTRTGAPA